MKLYLLTTTASRARGSALDGLGAARAGGRWSPRGAPVVYTCVSPSAAVLELLIHTGGLLPSRGLSVATIQIPAHCYEEAFQPERPPAWGSLGFDPRATVDTGRKWLDAGERLAMRVPSVACPLEEIVLLNPAHEDMDAVAVIGEVAYHVDSDAFSGARA